MLASFSKSYDLKLQTCQSRAFRSSLILISKPLLLLSKEATSISGKNYLNQPLLDTRTIVLKRDSRELQNPLLFLFKYGKAHRKKYTKVRPHLLRYL